MSDISSRPGALAPGWLVRLCFLVIGVLAIPWTCIAQPEIAKARRSVACIVASGDLDTMRTVRQFEIQFADVAKKKPQALLIELSGDRWRLDVVHAIAGLIRECPVSVTVWLHSPKGGTVGAGQAMLGLVAHECWISPKTEIVRKESDDRRDLAPKGTNFDRLSAELVRWAAERRDARGFDALAPGLLIGPMAPMWAIQEEGRAPKSLRLSPSAPDDGDSTGKALMEDDPTGSLALRIDADAAAGLRLVMGPASKPADVFEQSEFRAVLGVRMPVGANMDEIAEHAVSELAALDAELGAIEVELGAKPRDQRVNTQGFYKDLGRRVLDRAGKARERVDRCEKLTTDDPELLRTPPPGTSAVATTPDAHAAAWRRMFQKKRDQITRMQSKARGYMGR